MWLKYSKLPIRLEQRVYAQDPDLWSFQKPKGFWITDDSDRCWRNWCEAERFGSERLKCVHEVKLDESKILFINNAAEMVAFTSNYGIYQEGHGRLANLCIDWPAVARTFAGIIITPYQSPFRMEHDYSWYYGWDCASGCIWDTVAIEEVRELENESV